MLDFNGIKEEVNLIPDGTFAKARLVIKPTEFGDCVTKNAKGSEFLNCEFTITEGKYHKRKVFHRIGIIGSDEWMKMGKVMIKHILESAHNISKNDQSEHAQEARKISGYEDLNGLEVIIKIGIEKGNDEYGDRNKVSAVITPDHVAYKELTMVKNDWCVA